MNFVTVSELRSGELWKKLERQRDLVITKSGKPIAILSATDAESCEVLLRHIRSSRGLEALSAIQRDAVRRGLDKLTMDEIDEEIRAARRERKAC